MSRSLTRISVLAAVLGAALAFSGSALAVPSTPQLDPIPAVVPPGDLSVHWSDSTFDPGASGFYRLDVLDLTASNPWSYELTGTTQLIDSKLLLYGHQFSVCVTAIQALPTHSEASAAHCDTFGVGSGAWPIRGGEFWAGQVMFEEVEPRVADIIRSCADYRPVRYAGVRIDDHGVTTPIAA